MDRPNILFFMSDEQPATHAGCYGHRSIKTPAIDRLASEGAVFDAAYCASPISCPCRAAMMTGRHVSTIEVWDNASPLRSDWPTFAHSFRASGYRTILCGKMHFVGPDQRHGFEERWVQDIYPATFEWTRPNRHGVPVNTGQNLDRVYEAGIGWTADMDYDEEATFRAEYGLRRMARESNGRPFFLCVSLTGPHYPFRAPQAYWDRYRDDDVDLPRLPADYREREHEYVRWLRTHGKFDHAVPDDVCRRARRATLARTTMVDDYFARVMKALDQSGCARDTIIVYASDHGDMLGEHGLWFKNAAYDMSSRIPMIFSGPGVKTQRVSEAVSLLDLGSTLCGLAGVTPVYDRCDGRDLSPLLRGTRASGEGQAIMENYGEGVFRGWRMIRAGRYKLNYVPGCEPELFDLQIDPGEWTNLARDPALRDVRADLERRVLKDWDYEAADEKRYQSEERRLAILKAMPDPNEYGWQTPSAPVPHPLRMRAGPIDNIRV